MTSGMRVPWQWVVLTVLVVGARGFEDVWLLDQYLQFADSRVASTAFPTDLAPPWTIHACLRIDSSENYLWAHTPDSTSTQECLVARFKSGEFRLQYGATLDGKNDAKVDIADFSDDLFHSLAVVATADARMVVYLDGVYVGEDTFTAADQAVACSNFIDIGGLYGESSNKQMNGAMYEMVVHDKELNSTELAALCPAVVWDDDCCSAHYRRACCADLVNLQPNHDLNVLSAVGSADIPSTETVSATFDFTEHTGYTLWALLYTDDGAADTWTVNAVDVSVTVTGSEQWVDTGLGGASFVFEPSTAQCELRGVYYGPVDPSTELSTSHDLDSCVQFSCNDGGRILVASAGETFPQSGEQYALPIPDVSLDVGFTLTACVKITGSGYIYSNSKIASFSRACFAVSLNTFTDEVEIPYGQDSPSSDKFSVSGDVDDDQFHALAVVFTNQGANVLWDWTSISSGYAAFSGSVLPTSCTDTSTYGAYISERYGQTYDIDATMFDVSLYNRVLSDSELAGICPGIRMETECCTSDYRTYCCADATDSSMDVSQELEWPGWGTASDYAVAFSFDYKPWHTFWVEIYRSSGGDNTWDVNGEQVTHTGSYDTYEWVSTTVTGPTFTVTPTQTSTKVRAVYYGILDPSLDFGADFDASKCDCPLDYEVLLDSASSFPVNVTSSIPTSFDEAAVGGCINLAAGYSTYIYANTRTNADARCFSFYLGTNNQLAIFYGQQTTTGSQVSYYSAIPTDSLFDDWHSIAVSISTIAKTVTFFVDGVVLSVHTITSTSEFQTCPGGLAFIGARPPNPGHYAGVGTIEEVTIWNRTITTDDLGVFSCVATPTPTPTSASPSGSASSTASQSDTASHTASVSRTPTTSTSPSPSPSASPKLDFLFFDSSTFNGSVPVTVGMVNAAPSIINLQFDIRQYQDNTGDILTNLEGGFVCVAVSLDSSANTLTVRYGKAQDTTASFPLDTVIADGNWHGLAITSNATHIVVVVDGREEGVAAVVDGVDVPQVCGGEVVFGDGGFVGMLKDAYLFNYIEGSFLNPDWIVDEVVSLQNTTLTSFPVDPPFTLLVGGDSAWTLGACVYSSATTESVVFANAPSAADPNPCLSISLLATNEIRVSFSNSTGGVVDVYSGADANSEWNNEQWHSVVVVGTASQLAFYVDGVAVGSPHTFSPGDSLPSSCPTGVSLVGAYPPSPGTLAFAGTMVGSQLANYELADVSPSAICPATVFDSACCSSGVMKPAACGAMQGLSLQGAWLEWIGSEFLDYPAASTLHNATFSFATDTQGSFWVLMQAESEAQGSWWVNGELLDPTWTDGFQWVLAASGSTGVSTFAIEPRQTGSQIAAVYFGALDPTSLDWNQTLCSVDDLPPHTTITLDTYSAGDYAKDTLTLTFTLSEGSTDFTASSFTTTNIDTDLSALFANSDTVYAYHAVLLNDLEVSTVQLLVGGWTDATGVGNVDETSVSVIADLQDPTATYVSVSSNAPDPTLASVGREVALVVNVSEAVDAMRIAIADVEVTAVDVSGDGTGWKGTFVVPEGAMSGAVSVNATFRDFVGRLGVATATTDGSSVDIDADSPAVTFTSAMGSKVKSANTITVELSESVDGDLGSALVLDPGTTGVTMSLVTLDPIISLVGPVAFEITNPGLANVDLSQYQIVMWDSGTDFYVPTSPTAVLALSGSLGFLETYSVCDSATTGVVCDVEYTISRPFVWELQTVDNVTLDVWETSGSGFLGSTVCGSSYASYTVTWTRQSSITQGTTSWTESSTCQWDQGSYSDLGSHVLDSASLQVVVSDGSAAGFYSIEVASNSGVTDTAGNSLLYANISVEYDLTPPTISISSAHSKGARTNDNPLSFFFTASENVTNFELGDLATNCTDAVFTALSSSEYVLACTASDDVVGVEVPSGTMEDVVGNLNEFSVSYYLVSDITAPNSTVTSDGRAEGTLVNDDPIVFLVTLSEEPNTPLTEAHVTSGNCSNLAVTALTSVTFEVSCDANNGKDVEVGVFAGAVTDVAGNPVGQDSLLLRSDTEGPTATITTAYANMSVVNDEVLTFTITLSEEGTLTEADLELHNCVGAFSGSGSSYEMTCAAVDGKTVGVVVDALVFVDVAGNLNPGTANQFLVSDRTPPTTFLRATPPSYSNAVATNITFDTNEDYNAEGVGQGACEGATAYSPPNTVASASDCEFECLLDNDCVAFESDSEDRTVCKLFATTPSSTAGDTQFECYRLVSVDGPATSRCGVYFDGVQTSATATCTSPFEISTPLDGMYSFAYQSVDVPGNVEGVRLYNWTSDHQQPEAVFSTGFGSTTNLATHTLTVDFGEEVINFGTDDIAFDAGTTLASIGSITGSGAQRLIVMQGASGDGAYTLTASATGTATDLAGNTLLQNNTLEIVMDRSSPNVTVTVSGSNDGDYSNDSPLYFTFAMSKPSVFTAASVTSTNCNSLAVLEVSTQEFRVECAANDGKLVTVGVEVGGFTDVAGNPNDAATSFSLWSDRTNPTADIIADFADGGHAHDVPLNFTIAFNEVVTGFSVGSVSAATCDNQAFTALDEVDGFASQFLLQCTNTVDEGQTSVSVSPSAVYDRAGNLASGSPSFSVSMDFVVPDVQLTSPNATGELFSTTVLLDVVFSEGMYGFTADSVSVTSFGAGYAVGTVTSGSDGDSVFEVELRLFGDDSYEVTIAEGAAQDKGGNGNTAANETLYYTLVAPPETTLSFAQAEISNVDTFTLTVSFSKAVFGFSQSDLVITSASTGTSKVGGLSGSSGDALYRIPITLYGDDAYSFYVPAGVVEDAQLEVNRVSNVLNYTLETVKPTVTFAPDVGALGNVASFALGLTFSEPVYNFAPSDLSIVGSSTGAASSLSSTVVQDGDLARSVTVSLVGDDSYTISLPSGRVNDLAGNGNSASGSLLYTLDSTAPTLEISSGDYSNGDAANVDPMSFTFSLSEDSANFTAASLTAESCDNGGVASLSAASASEYVLTCYPTDGVESVVTVVAGGYHDLAGNPNTATPTFRLLSDLTPPSVALSHAQGEFGSAKTTTVTVEFSEGVWGFAATDLAVAITRTTTTTTPTATRTLVSGSSGDSTYLVRVVASADGKFDFSVGQGAVEDAGANANDASTALTYYVDTTAPTPTLSLGGISLLGARSSLSVTVSFGEPVSGFGSASLSVTGDTATVSSPTDTSGTLQTFVVPVTLTGSDGTYTIRVAAGKVTDRAANANLASANLLYTLDATAPSATITHSRGDVNNVMIFTLTVDFTEPVTGFDSSGIAAAIAATTTTTPSFTVSGDIGGNARDSTFTVPITLRGDGVYNFTVPAGSALDDASNGNLVSPGVVYELDQTAPTSKVNVSVGALDSSGAVKARLANITVTVELNEVVTGFTASDLSVAPFTTGAVAWRGTAMAVSSRAYTVDLRLSGDDIYVVKLPSGAVIDTAGNSNQESNTARYTLDATAPTATISTSPATLLNHVSPLVVTYTFNEAVTEVDFASLVQVESASSGTIAVSSTSALSTTRFSVSVTLSGDDTYTVTLLGGAFQDSVGNLNAASSAVVYEYDATLPVPTISYSAAASVSNQASLTVTVVFSETVTKLYASGLTISHSSKGSAQKQTASGVSGSTTYKIPVVLSGDDTYTFAVASGLVTDDAGNTNAAASSVTYTLDTAKPRPALSTSLTSPTNAQSFGVTVSFGASDQISGFSAASLSVVGATVGAVTPSSLTSGADGDNVFVVQVDTSADDTYTLSVPAGVATDLAGNANSLSSSLVLEVDTTAPSPTLSWPGVGSGLQNNTTPLTITVLFDEDVVGFNTSRVVVTATSGSGTATVGASATQDPNGTPDRDFLVVVTFVGDATYTVQATAGTVTDTAQNPNAETSQQYDLDTTSPTVAISVDVGTLNSVAVFTVTVAFDEAVFGFTADALQVVAQNGVGSGEATLATGSDGDSSYTLELTLAGDDDVFSLQLGDAAAHDEATNPSQASNSLSYQLDSVLPSAVLSRNVQSPYHNNPITVTAAFNEAVYGFSASSLEVTGTDADGNTAADASLALVSGADGSTSFTVRVTFAEDANYTIALPVGAVTDAGGNDNTASDLLLYLLDTEAPVLTVASSASALDILSTFTVTVTASSPVFGFTAADVAVVSSSSTSFSVTRGTAVSNADGTEFTVEVTIDTDGAYSLYVPAYGVVDHAQNPNAVSNTVAYDLDATRPTVVLSVASSLVNSAPSVTAAFSEDMAEATLDLGGVVVGVPDGSGALSPSLVGGYVFSLSPSVDGVYTVRFAAGTMLDVAGNTNAASNALSITYDATPPSIAVSVPNRNQRDVVVTVTFGEPVFSFDDSKASVAGADTGSGTAVAVGSTADGSLSLTIRLDLGADDVYTVTLGAGLVTDEAGNSNAEFQFDHLLDTVPPVASLSSPSAAQGSNTTITLTVEFSEPVVGWSSDLLLVTRNGGVVSTATALVVLGSTTLVADTSFEHVCEIVGGDGYYVFSVGKGSVQDDAENANSRTPSANEVVYDLDNTPPEARVSTDHGVISNASVITVYVSFDEDVTGFDIATMLSVTGADAGSSATASAGSATGTDGDSLYSVEYTLALDAGMDSDVFTLSVPAGVVQDRAGNVNDQSPADATYTLDQTAPQATLTLLGVTSGSVSARATSLTLTVEFSEEVQGFAGDDLSVSGPGVVDVGAVRQAACRLYVCTTVAFYVPLGFDADGVYTISVDGGDGVVDLAGNRLQATVGPSYQLETAAVSAVLALVGETSGAVGSNASLVLSLATGKDVADFASSHVVVAVSTDDPSSVAEAAATVVLGDATASGGGGGASEFTVAVSLGVDGTYSFSLPAGSVHDELGNANSASNTVEYTLDSTPPTVALRTSAQWVRDSQRAIVVTVEFSESVSGFSVDELVVTAAAGGAVSKGAMTTSYDGARYLVPLTLDPGDAYNLTVAAGVAYDRSALLNPLPAATTYTVEMISPTVAAKWVSFVDEDQREGVVGGTIVVRQHFRMYLATHWVAYFGDGAGGKATDASSPIASANATSVAEATVRLSLAPTDIPASGSRHVIVFAVNRADGGDEFEASLGGVEAVFADLVATPDNDTAPTAAAFTDADMDVFAISGALEITQGASLANTTHYVVYYGTGTGGKWVEGTDGKDIDGSPIAWATATTAGTALSITIPDGTPITSSRTQHYFLVLASNGLGDEAREAAVGFEFEFVDAVRRPAADTLALAVDPFVDEDATNEEVGGLFTFTPSYNLTDVSSYALFFGDGSGNALDLGGGQKALVGVVTLGADGTWRGEDGLRVLSAHHTKAKGNKEEVGEEEEEKVGRVREGVEHAEEKEKGEAGEAGKAKGAALDKATEDSDLLGFSSAEFRLTQLTVVIPHATAIPLQSRHLVVFAANGVGEARVLAAEGVEISFLDLRTPPGNDTAPSSVAFSGDANDDRGVVAGTLTVAAGSSVAGLTHFGVYFATDAAATGYDHDRLVASVEANTTADALSPTGVGDTVIGLAGVDLVETARAFAVVPRSGTGEEAENGLAFGLVAFSDLVRAPSAAAAPASASFTDINREAGTIQGTVVLFPSSDTTDVGEYACYFGDGAGGKLSTDPIGTVAYAATATAALQLVVGAVAIAGDGSTRTLIVFPTNRLGAEAMEGPTGLELAFTDALRAPDFAVVATALSFTDADNDNDQVSGSVVVTQSTDFTNVVEYALYFGDGEGGKLDGEDAVAIASADANDAAATVTITVPADTVVPSGTQSFIVFAANRAGSDSSEGPNGLEVNFADVVRQPAAGAVASSASFTDIDTSAGAIGGTVELDTATLVTTDATHWVVYFADDAGDKVATTSAAVAVGSGIEGAITSEALSGDATQSVFVDVHTAVPATATRLYVVAVNSLGLGSQEAASHVLVAFEDVVAPESLAYALHFEDENTDANHVTGVVSWALNTTTTAASSGLDLVVYFGTSGESESEVLGQVSSLADPQQLAIDTELGEGITHVLVFSVDTATGLKSDAVASVAVVDLVGPPGRAQNVSFVDADPVPGLLQGNVTWALPADTTSLSHFTVWLATTEGAAGASALSPGATSFDGRVLTDDGVALVPVGTEALATVVDAGAAELVATLPTTALLTTTTHVAVFSASTANGTLNPVPAVAAARDQDGPTAVPPSGSFADTDPVAFRVTGVLSWLPSPSEAVDVHSYEVWLGSSETQRVGGRALFAVAANASLAAYDSGTEIDRVNTTGATHWLVFSKFGMYASQDALAVPLGDLVGPAATAENVAFADTNPSAGVVRGTVSWDPISDADVASVEVWVGEGNAFADPSPTSLQATALGTDTSVELANTTLRFTRGENATTHHLFVFTLTSDGIRNPQPTVVDVADLRWPAHPPRQVTFTDTNATAGVLSGDVVWQHPKTIDDVVGFQVVLASSPASPVATATHVGFVDVDPAATSASLAMSGVARAFDEDYLLVFSVGANATLPTPGAAAVVDLGRPALPATNLRAEKLNATALVLYFNATDLSVLRHRVGVANHSSPCAGDCQGDDDAGTAEFEFNTSWVVEMPETAVVVQGLREGQLYTLVVQAANDGGYQANGARLVGYFTDTTPSAPTGVTVTHLSHSTVTLRWDAVHRANFYRVQRRVVGTTAWTLVHDEADFVRTASTTATRLASGVSYEFRVLAGNWAGFETDGASITAHPLSSVTDLRIARVNEDSITVQWDVVSGSDVVYMLEYKELEHPDWAFVTDATALAFTGSVGMHTVEGLRESVQYVVRVYCGDGRLDPVVFELSRPWVVGTPAQRVSREPIRNEFSTGELSAAWGWTREPPMWYLDATRNDPDTTALTIVPTLGDLWSVANASMLLRDHNANFDMAVEVGVNVTSGCATAGLVAFSALTPDRRLTLPQEAEAQCMVNNTIHYGCESVVGQWVAAKLGVDASSASVLSVEKRKDDTSPGLTAASPTFSSSAHGVASVHLRMRREGNVFSVFHKDVTAQMWRFVSQTSEPLRGDVRIGVFAGACEDPTEALVTFANFQNPLLGEGKGQRREDGSCRDSALRHPTTSASPNSVRQHHSATFVHSFGC